MTIERALAAHPFFSGVDDDVVRQVAPLAEEVAFATGQTLCREGDVASRFFLVEHGNVSLSLETPKGPLVVETLGQGDVIGWSWAVPPHRWRFDARASSMVRAIAVDGDALRTLMRRDAALGLVVMERLASVMAHRLAATRVQLVDIYGGRRERA